MIEWELEEETPVEILTDKPSMTVSMKQKSPVAVFRPEAGLANLDEEYNKLKVLPKFACNSCHISSECPEYNPGFVCAYDKAFKAFPARDSQSVMAVMREIVDTNKTRWMRARMAEELRDGGDINPQVTKLSQTLMDQYETLVNLSRATSKVDVKVTGTDSQSLAKKGGVLSRLFGAGNTETITLNEEDK